MVRGLMSLMQGSLLAKAVGIASLPIITRIYSVESIGILSTVNSLVLILLPLVTLQYTAAIPISRSGQTSAATAILSIGFALGITVGILGTLLIFPMGKLLTSAMAPVEPFLWLVPIFAFIAAINEACVSWLVRSKQYSPIARSQMLQSGAGESVKIASGLCGFTSGGLLLGQLVLQMIGSLSALCYAKRSWPTRTDRVRDPKFLKVVAAKFQDMPKFRVPAQLAMMFAIQAPVLFAAWFYSTKDAALVGMASTALSIPFLLVGQAARRVYYGEIASLGPRNPVGIKQVTYLFMTRLFALSMPAAIGIYFLSEPLFEVAFGPEWREAGRLASVMSFYLAFQFTASPLLDIFSVYHRQSAILAIHLQRAVLTTASFALSFWLNLGLFNAILIFSSALCLHYLLTTIRIHFFVEKKCEEYGYNTST